MPFILLDSLPGAVCAVAGIVTVTVMVFRLSKSKFDMIPTVGDSGWFGPWWVGNKFQTNADEVIQEGYEKYKSIPFKVADRYRWIVVFGGRQHIEEIRKAPDDALSFQDAVNDSMRLDYIMGAELFHTRYHDEIIRSRLTRNLGNLFPEIRDEISIAFDEVLDLKDDDWKNVPALSVIQKVVCRTSNRMFVGLPLCRDLGWIDLNLGYTLDVVDAGKVFRRFPVFLAPIITHFVKGPHDSAKRAMKYLAPIIAERLKLMEEHGNDWTGKPNDLVSWLLDEAPEGPERTVRLWTARVLATNFAAIHTTSNSFSHALFYLAENPQYIQPLREEVETIVRKEGWSKTSMGKMYKVDSFLKECQRLVGLGSLSLGRMVMKDFTFSDGTFIPKGTIVAAPSRSLHLDDEHYDNAHTFNPFRFSDMRANMGEDTKHHFVSTSPEYLVFGHGKHACPGRFFASNELKSMLAHVVMSYDVKLEENMIRPKGLRDGATIAADPFAKVMFRKRAH